jgi:hypothetical protein
MTIDLEQKIRERAYQIWEREGRAHGRHEEHWHAARRELAATPDASAIAVPARKAEPARSKAEAAKTKAEPAKSKADGAKKSRKQATPVPPQPEPVAAAPRRRRPPARPAQ